MSYQSNISMTGSKWFGLLIIFISAVLTWKLEEATIWISTVSVAVGLYVNKQYQDRMKVKYETETNHQNQNEIHKVD